MLLTEELTTPGLGEAAAIAVDADGRIVVADIGPDCQVEVYGPRRKWFRESRTRYGLVRTAGRKGGRSRRGEFDGQAM